MEHDFEFLINFVKAQEESPDNPVDVVDVSSQTGDFGIWLIIALLAIAVVSAVAIFLYRKYSFNNAGHSVSGLNFTGFKSKTSTIVGVVVALIAACSILIYLGVSKAEAKNDVIPIEINAQVFSDGHIEVDDTSFPNTGDIPLIASSTYLILNESVQGDEKLQASHLTFKAFEGTVFDGNPDDSYITEDAFGVVYPGEDCHLSIQIDNLDAQTALSYIDYPVYSLYMPVRYGDKLAFEVDPSDAPEANVLISKDGSWINYENNSKTYEYGTKFTVDQNDPSILNAYDTDWITLIDQYKLPSGQGSEGYIYYWNSEPYIFGDTPMIYNATNSKYYYATISTNNEDFGNVYNSVEGGDVVSSITGDIGTEITYENYPDVAPYEKSTIHFIKDGQQVTYYALPTRNEYEEYQGNYFGGWLNLPQGPIWKDPSNDITAKFVFKLDRWAGYITVNDDIENIMSDPNVYKWSGYLPVKTSIDLYVDGGELEDNALEYFYRNGFELKPMRDDSILNVNNNYIVSSEPLSIYDEYGNLIKEESNIIIGMINSSSYSLFSDVMLENITLREFLFEGTGSEGKFGFIDEESYISDPIIFRPDLEFNDDWEEWLGHHTIVDIDGTEYDTKYVNFPAGTLYEVNADHQYSSGPYEPIWIDVALPDESSTTLYYSADDEFFSMMAERGLTYFTIELSEDYPQCIMAIEKWPEESMLDATNNNDQNNDLANEDTIDDNNDNAGFFFGWFDALKTIDILKLFV